MKILHVIQRYWPYTGGSERHLQEISERLVRRGHQVTVFTTDALDLELFWNPRKQRVAPPVELHNGVEIRRFPVRHLPGSPYTFGGVRRLMNLIADVAPTPALRALAGYVPWVPDLVRELRAGDEPFDVVHGMNVCFEALLLPALARARRQRIPFIVTPLIHLGESEQSLVRRYYTMPHQIELIARADAILAQTPLESQYLIGRGVDPERLVQAGVGVNPDEVLGGDGERFRAATGIARPFVAFVNTSCFDKGTVHLVEAMRRIWDRGGSPAEADLVLAGPVLDPFRDYLETLPAEHRARVHVLGFIDEALKRDLFDAAALVAMPSRTDSIGIVYLEGWLYRKPVIGARAGGVAAVIEDGVDGFLVEFGDVAAIAERITLLLSDRSRARELGERGYAKVMRSYTWDRIYPVVEEVYERLCPRATVG